LPVNLVTFNQGIHFVNSVYVDANLICYARNRLSQKYRVASQVLGELIVQKVTIFISHLVLDEIWWALLRVWYRGATGNNLYPTTVKSNPGILNSFAPLIRRNTLKTVRLPNVFILPTVLDSIQIILAATDIFSTEGLMPRDCFHLAFVKSHNIMGFVTSDTDFDHLTLPNYNLTVYKY